jgi:peroxiredoxin
LPSLENLHQHFHSRPFSLLAIDVGEKKETVQKFVEERGLSFTFLLDQDTAVSSLYGVRSHPMKFLIDKEGRMIGVSLGYGEWDNKDMRSLMELLINSK